MVETDPSISAKRLWCGSTFAMLATHSREQTGFPFGSLVPYCLDFEGKAVVLISRLAKHTQNIQSDQRVSLLVSGPQQDDIQTTARLNVWGEMRPMPHNQTVTRYFRYFPQAEGYRQELDFEFYQLNPHGFYYVADFGRIHSFPADLAKAVCLTEDLEASVIAHMNQDHVAALRTYCERLGVSVENQDPVMVGADTLGIHLRLGSRLLRLDFESPLVNAAEIRAGLTAMARDRENE